MIDTTKLQNPSPSVSSFPSPLAGSQQTENRPVQPATYPTNQPRTYPTNQMQAGGVAQSAGTTPYGQSVQNYTPYTGGELSPYMNQAPEGSRAIQQQQQPQMQGMSQNPYMSMMQAQGNPFMQSQSQGMYNNPYMSMLFGYNNPYSMYGGYNNPYVFSGWNNYYGGY